MKMKIFENNSKGSTYQMVERQETWKKFFTFVMGLKEKHLQIVEERCSCKLLDQAVLYMQRESDISLICASKKSRRCRCSSSQGQ